MTLVGIGGTGAVEKSLRGVKVVDRTDGLDRFIKP